MREGEGDEDDDQAERGIALAHAEHLLPRRHRELLDPHRVRRHQREVTQADQDRQLEEKLPV